MAEQSIVFLCMIATHPIPSYQDSGLGSNHSAECGLDRTLTWRMTQSNALHYAIRGDADGSYRVV